MGMIDSFDRYVTPLHLSAGYRTPVHADKAVSPEEARKIAALRIKAQRIVDRVVAEAMVKVRENLRKP